MKPFTFYESDLRLLNLGPSEMLKNPWTYLLLRNSGMFNKSLQKYYKILILFSTWRFVLLAAFFSGIGGTIWLGYILSKKALSQIKSLYLLPTYHLRAGVLTLNSKNEVWPIPKNPPVVFLYGLKYITKNYSDT